MTDKIGPLGESLKPGEKSETSDSNKSTGSASSKHGRKKPVGRLGNNKPTGGAKKLRKAASSKKASIKKAAVKKSLTQEPTTKAATKKAVGKKASVKKDAAKKAVAKKFQSTPTKKPPASKSASTDKPKHVVDPDKTSVVDVKKELGRSRPSLLDRLLDQSLAENEEHSPAKDTSSTKITNGNVDSENPRDEKKFDELFSNLDRPFKDKESSSSDDFEDLLFGGLRGSETPTVVQSKSKAQHWNKEDNKRPTDIPSKKAGRGKKPTNRVMRDSSTEAAPKDVNKIDEDATDEIRGDHRNPIGRQISRPKRKTPSAAAEPKALVDESKDSSESTTIHETPSSELEEQITKPEADTTSGTKPSDDSSVSEGASALRRRARKKAEAAKKRLTEQSEIDENTQSTAELLKENTTSTVQDKDEPLEVSNDSEISSREIHEEIEEQESEDGFERSDLPDDFETDLEPDVTSEIDRRGRGFKVSTESVKQSLRPPPRVRARKVRRVVRHIDPWSVLTFSVLFHLTIFSSLLLGSVLIWQVAAASGTIENLEDVVKDLGSFESYELNGWAVFRAAVAVAAIFTLASTILVVIMSVIFNLISDLVGGIRVTVVQEETVRVQRDK